MLCSECRKRIVECKKCRRCEYCGCACRYCERCNKKAPYHGCSICGLCKKGIYPLCKCRKRKASLHGVNHQVALLRPLAPITNLGEAFVRGGSRIINKLIRPVGIEIEIADWNSLRRWIPKDWEYDTHPDSSVKPSGMEMVLSPMSGDLLIERMNEVGQALIKYQCTINNTCGLHVHVSGMDISWWEVKKLLLLWKGIENDVFSYFVDLGRKANRFCKPIYFSPSTWKLISSNSQDIRVVKGAIFNDLYGVTISSSFPQDMSSIESIKSNKYPDCRYRALNIHSWLRQGTFEFRLHEGTVDAVEIIKWAMFCGWIVEAVNIISFEQAKSIFEARAYDTKAIKMFRDLISNSEFSIKHKPILPDEVINFINERIS